MPAQRDPARHEKGLEKWLELNRGLSTAWPNITRKGEAPADADNFRDERDKSQNTSRTSRPYDPDSKWEKQACGLAIVATIKTAPGKRDEYLKHLRAHAERCAPPNRNLQFEILVPQKEEDSLMLYEVYASPEAFQAHWEGQSMKQVRRTRGAQLSLSGVRCDLVE